MDLKSKKIAILATHGFEQAELEVRRDRLKKAGVTVDSSPWQAAKSRVGTRRIGAGR
jgi:putative intracellular protease/amidase